MSTPNHLTDAVTNGVYRAKITGAKELANVISLVIDGMAENGTVVLTTNEVKKWVERAAKEYELLMLRKLK